MSTSPEIRRRKYSLFVLAIIVLLLGGAALFFGSNNPMMLALGGLMCVLSAYLVKLSNVHGKAGSAVAGRDGVGLGALRHPRPGVWAVGAAALVALGISFFYLHQDAVRGYHEILPVYAFTALVLICAVVWGYLISKLMQKH